MIGDCGGSCGILGRRRGGGPDCCGLWLCDWASASVGDVAPAVVVLLRAAAAVPLRRRNGVKRCLPRIAAPGKGARELRTDDDGGDGDGDDETLDNPKSASPVPARAVFTPKCCRRLVCCRERVWRIGCTAETGLLVISESGAM